MPTKPDALAKLKSLCEALAVPQFKKLLVWYGGQDRIRLAAKMGACLKLKKAPGRESAALATIKQEVAALSEADRHRFTVWITKRAEQIGRAGRVDETSLSE